jgi:predicted ATPase
LRQQFATTLQSLVGWHTQRGEFEQALHYAQRWLQLDSLHEVAQRMVMRLYAWSGQHAAAMRQYRACVRLLDTELGIEPEAETTALYEEITRRRLPIPVLEHSSTANTPVAVEDAVPQVSPHPHRGTTLPHVGAFVGRQRELTDLVRRLTDPACRLLTVVGPGGVGKTSLAIQAARILAEGWAEEETLADGVLFVPLAAVETRSGFLSALAGAAGFEFYPSVLPQQQVCDYFQSKRMLLLLDNFEQLTPEAAFLGTLLEAAPYLRVFVTSRVALNLREEWFHPLEGLSFPAHDVDTSVARLAYFDAVRLFDQHARRVRSDFVLSRERKHVVRLCHIVAGMPLAIELATSWLKTLSVAEVVAALERGLDILTTRDRNIPERHRSMRVVLEESCRLLPEAVQQVFPRLSVFAGGFRAEVAQEIAGASLDVLATLVDQSLLRSEADGRFTMHELLRQFAAERLAADLPQAQAMAERHSAYYLGFLAEREARLDNHEYRTAVAEIAREAANVRAAWGHALAHRDVERIGAALAAYYLYHYMRNDFQEGADVFGEALAIESSGTSHAHQTALARLHIRYGSFRLNLGDYATAVREIEYGLGEARRLELPTDVAFSLIMLGSLAKWHGNIAEAYRTLVEALACATATNTPALVAHALRELAGASNGLGDFEAGDRLAQESLALSRTHGRDDLITDVLMTLAWSSACRGEYARSEAYYRECLVLAERVGDDVGVAGACHGLAWVSWCVGGPQLDQAHEYITRSLEIDRQRGLYLWLCDHLGDLALIAIDRGDYTEAWSSVQEALALSRARNSKFLAAYNLSIMGHVAALRHEFAASRALLCEALQIGLDAHLWVQLSMTVYHVAQAFMHEAAVVGNGNSTFLARQQRVAELCAALSLHSGWHVFQARAQRQLDVLCQDLPASVLEAAIAYGHQFEWPSSVEQLLAELNQPVVLPEAASIA